MADPHETLKRLVRRHAATTRLFGADFMPVYRARHRNPTPEPDLDQVSEIQDVVETTAIEPSASTVGVPVVNAVETPLVVIPRMVDNGSGSKESRLRELRARYEREAPHQHFVTAFTNIVFGEGDPHARLMFVGEAPGAEEDRTGRPFVGRAGELLNKMIGAMGLSREQVYIANVLKTRPPDNATPTAHEIELCAPFLFEQIDIISPEVIVALGLPACRALLRTEESMARMRSRWHEFTTPSGKVIPVMPTYHPAYVLRNYNEETRGKVWADLQMAMDKLGLKAGARGG